MTSAFLAQPMPQNGSAGDRPRCRRPAAHAIRREATGVGSASDRRHADVQGHAPGGIPRSMISPDGRRHLAADRTSRSLGELPSIAVTAAGADRSAPWDVRREGWRLSRRRDTHEHRRSPHWLKMKCEASQSQVGIHDHRYASAWVRCSSGISSRTTRVAGRSHRLTQLLLTFAHAPTPQMPSPPFNKATGLHARAHRAAGSSSGRVIEWTVTASPSSACSARMDKSRGRA